MTQESFPGPQQEQFDAARAAFDARKEELGLTNGHFNVHRSDGTVEEGWSVVGFGQRADKDGNPYEAALITKPSPEDPRKTLSKRVKVDDLVSWQNKPGEEDSRIITRVPQTEEEAREMLDRAEQLRQAESDAERNRKADELLAKLKELEAPFSEQDQHNLWRYAAGRMNKRTAQERGDGNDSIFQEQQAGQALRALSPEAQEVASDYLATMDALERVRLS